MKNETFLKRFIKNLVNARFGIRPVVSEQARPKSSMELWAEREIALACAKEREDSGIPDKEWDYGCACYTSAGKAFKTLLEEGHSGFSMSMTQQILNRLIDGNPLTPIVDTPDIWSATTWDDDKGRTVYQCTRMSSLFKHVADDGTVEYNANDHYYCVDINNGAYFHNGFIGQIIHDMYPIKMPYWPTKPIKVYCEDLLTDPKNGDFDTLAIHYLIDQQGERVEVNRYFKQIEDGWEEINSRDWASRALASKLLYHGI